MGTMPRDAKLETSPARDTVDRGLKILASGGAAIWALLWLLPIDHIVRFDLLDRMALLAVLVVVPLGVLLLSARVKGDSRATKALALSAHTLPLGCLAAVLSFLGSCGPLPGALACVWALSTAGIGTACALNLKSRGRRALRENPMALLSDLSGIGLFFGGVWLAAARFGALPLSLNGTEMQTIAIHWHFACFAMPLQVSLCLEAAPQPTRVRNLIVFGAMLGLFLLFLGRLVFPSVTALGALVLGIALSFLALTSGWSLLERFLHPTAHVLFSVAMGSIVAGMAIGILHALGNLLARPVITPHFVLWTHGILNGLFFSAGGLAAWCIGGPTAPTKTPLAAANPVLAETTTAA